MALTGTDSNDNATNRRTLLRIQRGAEVSTGVIEIAQQKTVRRHISDEWLRRATAGGTLDQLSVRLIHVGNAFIRIIRTSIRRRAVAIPAKISRAIF